MKDHQLVTLGVLAVISACVVQTSETITDDQSTSSGQLMGPYPTSSPTVISSPPEDPSPWRCGIERITVKGPDGKLIELEIALKCDPMADDYKGDPAPEENKKKAPYETGPDLKE